MRSHTPSVETVKIRGKKTMYNAELRLQRRSVTTWRMVMIVMICLGSIWGIMSLVKGFAQEGTWLTAPLVKGRDDLLFMEGPDLQCQNLYTYSARDKWVALNCEGYINGANAWTVTEKFKRENPNWPTIYTWTVDFWWPTSRGPLPPGAQPGTSSK